MRTSPWSLTSTSTIVATYVKTFMRRDPDAEALAVFPLSPAIFFRDHLRDVAQTTGLPWISFQRGSIIRVVHTVEIDRARLSDQIEQILEWVAPGGVSEFIREGLNCKPVIDVCHRAQPADAHVSLRRAVLDAKIWQIVRNIRPALLQVIGVAVNRIHLKNGRNRRKDRAL